MPARGFISPLMPERKIDRLIKKYLWMNVLFDIGWALG